MVNHEFSYTTISPMWTCKQKCYVIFICTDVRNHKTKTNYQVFIQRNDTEIWVQ